MLKGKLYTQRDELIALAILPIYYLFFNYMLFKEAYVQRLDVFLYATGSIIVFWTPIYFLHALPAIYLRKRFPETKQFWIRMPIAVLIHMTMSGLAILGFFYGYKWVNFPGFTFDNTSLYFCLGVTWFCNILLNVLHEYVYTVERWKRTLKEAEALKRVNIQSQLDALKQQVNPHFLFNSLNSLISLIGEDPAKAEAFAEELSSVYRYVLRTNRTEGDGNVDIGQNLTDLHSELDFIQSYHHLLKTRHGAGISLVVQVDERFKTYRIPPLTLQLLVENAVKHNIALPEQPLHIAIEADEPARLRVRNTLQKKKTRVLSNGVGLSNILAKYQMLGQPLPTVEETDGEFLVTLPLIEAP